MQENEVEVRDADWYFIDAFRLIRQAGRSNPAKANAVASYIAQIVANERQQAEDGMRERCVAIAEDYADHYLGGAPDGLATAIRAATIAKEGE